MKLIDVQHSFFRPVWRRVVVVAICLGWAVYELATGSPFFASLFGAVGLYCLHQFFIVFAPKDPE